MKNIRIIPALVASLVFVTAATTATAGELPAYYLTMNSVADVNSAAVESRIPALDGNREVLVSAAAGVNVCNFATQFTFEDASGHPVSVESVKITTINFGVISVINGVTTHHVNHLSMAASKFNDETTAGKPNIYMTNASGVIVSPSNVACTTKVTAAVRHVYITDQPVPLGAPAPFPKLAAVGDSYNLYRDIQMEYTIGGVTYASSLLDTAASVQVVGIVPAFPQSSTPSAAGPLEIVKSEVVTSEGEGGGSSTIKMTVAGLDESWPYNTTLEWSTDLVNWSEATGIGSGKNGDGTWYLTSPVSSPRRFFRLTRPKRWNWLIGD